MSQIANLDTRANKLSQKAMELLLPGNFYNFCKIVMLRDLEPQPHQEMCSVAELAMRKFENYYIRGVTPGTNDKTYFICMTPRDSFKSTVWSECMPVYLALKFPDIRILIDSENVGKAEKFAAAGKEHFEANSKLRAYYGTHHVPESRNDAVWSRGQYRIASRRRVGLKEHTVMTCGIGTTMPGMHYDVIICDDLVSEKNVTSPDQVQKVFEHIQYMQSLLTPGGLLFIIGTRWHFDDAYSKIIDDPIQCSEYNLYIRSAGGILDPDPQTGIPKPLYFPNRLTEGFLAKKLKLQKRYIFSCQYLNSPVSTDDLSFDVNKYNYMNKKSFLKDIIRKPKSSNMAHGNFRWEFICDPAITDDKKKVKGGDFTAMAAFITTPDNQFYIFGAKTVKAGEDTVVDEIYDHFIRLKKELGYPERGHAHIETVAFQLLLKGMLKKKTKEKGEKIKWKEMIPLNKEKKEVRIRSAIPYIEDREITIVDDAKEPSQFNLKNKANQQLITQASRFPRTANDDMLDIQGYAIQICKFPKQGKSEDKRLPWECRSGKTPLIIRPGGLPTKQNWEDFEESQESIDDLYKRMKPVEEIEEDDYWPQN